MKTSFCKKYDKRANLPAYEIIDHICTIESWAGEDDFSASGIGTDLTLCAVPV